jgi:hypothetical protein
MRAILALIKTAVLLLANIAGRPVEEIAATVVSKEFIEKHFAACEPFLEMTLTSKLQRELGKRKDVVTHGSIIVSLSLRF